MRSGRSGAASSSPHAKFSSGPDLGRFQIISNLSHELRSPLHVLNGYLAILAEDWSAEFSDEPLRILERLRLNSAELTQTVENLLEYTAAVTDTQATVKETVNVTELIGELEPRFAAAAQGKKILLVWRVQPHIGFVHSDRRRLVSIINNLVSNAIKFTEHGRITILLRCLHVRHKYLMELEVTDTGIEIDEGRLNDAFAPFVQLSDSNSRDYRGLGLGLALVRRNVIALGATLEVESKRCAGSRFKVRFPGGTQA